MAIRRCPYCKAIIDESQKYCNNCGTQLLFPEDEFVAEEIKGEKIVDEEIPKGEDDEFEKSLDPDAEEGTEKEEIDLEEVIEGGASFPDEEHKEEEIEEEDIEEEEILEPEKKLDEELDENPNESPVEEKLAESAGEGADEAESPEPAAKPEPAEEDHDRLPAWLRSEDKAEPVAPPAEEHAEEERESEILKEVTEEEAQVGELEEAKPATDTKEEIARLIAALEKRHKRTALSEEDKKILATIEESGDLPPWAQAAGRTESGELGARVVDEGAEEKNLVSGDSMDFKEEILSSIGNISPPRSTAGLPESVAGKKDTEDIEEAETEDTEEGVFEVRASEGERRDSAAERTRYPLGFLRRIKAVFYDLILIAILWLAGAWLASRLMAVSLPALIAAAPVPLVFLFIVFLGGYLFLFLFFLGETLGGRLSAPRD
jgi:hypothetical protein